MPKTPIEDAAEQLADNACPLPFRGEAIRCDSPHECDKCWLSYLEGKPCNKLNDDTVVSI